MGFWDAIREKLLQEWRLALMDMVMRFLMTLLHLFVLQPGKKLLLPS